MRAASGGLRVSADSPASRPNQHTRTRWCLASRSRIGIATEWVKADLPMAFAKRRSTDAKYAVLASNVVKMVNTIDVYQDGRTEQAHVEGRDEALAACEHLGVVAVLPEQRHHLNTGGIHGTELVDGLVLSVDVPDPLAEVSERHRIGEEQDREVDLGE